MDRWIKEAIHIRKEQDKSMNTDDGSYQLSHIYDRPFATSGSERIWGELALGSQNNTPEETNGINNAVSCYKEAVLFSASFDT